MNNNFYPSSKPIRVADGLKARSTRGAIGTSWWSKRFLTVLESMGMGSRLTRGRAYARKGQVIELNIAPGQVNALVQGSRPRPYAVRIELGCFTPAQWDAVHQVLNADAWFVASLLDGQMPEEIEVVFAGLGLPLFPANARALRMSCSCPDSAVPCKHLAAAFYLLAERFDADPFDILSWRGRDREALLGSLQAPEEEPIGSDEGAGAPLADLLESFYTAVKPATRTLPRGSALLIDQLPSTGLKLRGKPLEEALRPVYQALRDS